MTTPAVRPTTEDTTNRPRGAGAGTRGISIGLFTVVVSIAFEAISVATAMPVAARELNGISLYAWAFSLFLIGQLFATIASGRLSDRIGPARPMAGGIVLFVIGLVVAGTAPTFLQLIAGRLLQGLGSGVIAIAMYVVIAQVYDESVRPRMFSLISTAWVLPSFVGPTVSAWLTHHLGWRAVFWTVVPLAIAGAALMLPKIMKVGNVPIPTHGASVAKPAALWAAGLAALGAAGIQFAGQQLNALGLVCGIVGLVLVGLSLPNLMPKGFFRFGPGLPPVILVRLLMAGAFFGAESFVPLMLVEQRDLALLLSGTALTIGAVGWTTGSYLQARPNLPVSRGTLVTLGAASLFVGVVATALVSWLELWVGFVAIAWIFAGLGMGLATASTSVATMALSAPGEQGRNASSLQFGEAFGGGLFIGVSGSIFAALHPTGDLDLTFGSVLTAMAGVALLAVIASFRTGRLADPG